LRKIKKLAIANRGEVAVRIIHACRELGIETVFLHSEADAGSMPYRLSDQQICIGESEAAKSYLLIDNVVNGAIGAGADAIHPGFGFLSESAPFARACAEKRIIFVGPSPECIDLFGDKVLAKKHVESVGGPTIPGYMGDDQSVETLAKEAKKIGLPLLVKAANGGGGRGIKIVRKEQELEDAIVAAKREGLAFFGSDKVFLEKYFESGKHIEVQIFGDSSSEVFHLGERECSVQRKHQKIIEESPSPSLDPVTRTEICEAAVKIVKSAGYKSAGTVEFLYVDGKFYFLEVNTRLQVEHPVTELVQSVDLVKAQILTAQEIALNWSQSQMQPRGHSIEARLYAEDSFKNGMPSTGLIGYMHLPQGPGRRFDMGYEAGDSISQYYDSMVGKLIVFDENRPRAIKKMRVILDELTLFGLNTNVPLLKEIFLHKEFVDGEMTTAFIQKYFPEGLSAKSIDSLEPELINDIRREFQTSAGSQGQSTLNPWYERWT
jgi:acetyl/propionyl-CoA carboxylase alpha subunit